MTVIENWSSTSCLLIRHVWSGTIRSKIVKLYWQTRTSLLLRDSWYSFFIEAFLGRIRWAKWQQAKIEPEPWARSMAEPLPDLCRFLVHHYRFLVHRTFTQPSVRMTAANVLEIIAVTLATCLNRKFPSRVRVGNVWVCFINADSWNIADENVSSPLQHMTLDAGTFTRI